jgi:rsbT co-antagonist protein RsbR
MASTSNLADLIRSHESEVLKEWLQSQRESVTMRRDLINDAELERQSRDFLRAFSSGLAESNDILSPGWTSVRELVTKTSESRARQGFTPSETATFIFSLKQPLFALIRRNRGEAEWLGADTWTATTLLDALGLLTAEAYVRSREEIINRQQQEMLELSTPVVTLWEGVLALPLIGTLDSMRTQIVMESLLQRIVETGSLIAILDITGVPTVDTLVAQHLLKTVAAARLMGADCIISGIRPQIAQTIVHLGVDLNSVTTKATLADAFAVALKRLGKTVAPVTSLAPGRPTNPTPIASDN